ncbi:MAG: redoxin domain-containing protein [Planctomycetales bacterium]
MNCVRNYPWYKGWHDKYAKRGLTVIGVHTPETEGEKDIDAVRKSAEEKELKYPIVIDNDAAIWKAWGNQWWPCTYLIDKQGIVRYRWDGELNWKKNKGEALLRKKIEQLLAEPAPKKPPAAVKKGKR